MLVIMTLWLFMLMSFFCQITVAYLQNVWKWLEFVGSDNILPSFDVDSGLSPGRTPLDYGTGRTPLEGYQVLKKSWEISLTNRMSNTKLPHFIAINWRCLPIHCKTIKVPSEGSPCSSKQPKARILPLQIRQRVRCSESKVNMIKVMFKIFDWN